MDGSAQYAPRPLETALALVAGVLLLAVTPTLDLAGVLLVGLAGLFLLGLAGADILLRPRLRADAGGVTVRTVGRQVAGPWPVVELRVRPTQRLGVVSHTLELDIGEALVVFGRRELGADPREVARVLDDLREAG